MTIRYRGRSGPDIWQEVTLKIKIFNYFTRNINPPIEIQINNWLSENPDIEIIKLIQSEAMAAREDRFERSMTISLLYREK